MSGSRDAILRAPVLDDGGRAADLLGCLPDVAEPGEYIGYLAHGHRLTNLHGSVQEICADDVQLFCNVRRMVHENLKALRKRSGMSVREVANQLGYDQHSKYGYYESARFKGRLPVDLARQLAKMWQYLKVEPHEVLELAGFSKTEAIEDFAVEQALRYQPRLMMQVMMPSERALTRMFEGMFEAIGQPEKAARFAQPLAQLLPVALAATPVGADEMADSPADPALVERLRFLATDDLASL